MCFSPGNGHMSILNMICTKFMSFLLNEMTVKRTNAFLIKFIPTLSLQLKKARASHM